METILITTLTVTGISGIFAFLLTLADRTVGNYGEVNLFINNDEPLIVEGGDSLLSTLIDQKIFIPSACGGKGTCGYCKVAVIEGGGPVLSTETPWLTDEEIKDNVRLSCQCKVKNDIKIVIPEDMFNIKEYPVLVESIEDVTSTIRRLRLKLPEGEKIDFKPGQYVQLKAPLYKGNDEEVYRAYSVASSASDKDHIELVIGYTGGLATTYVHQILNEGDYVDINGPYGDFYYHDDDSEMILIAVGTGIAPIIAILHHLKENDIKRKARFYFGAKTPEDLLYLDELRDFEESLYDFKFMPTLSRTTEEHNWTGDTGRVTDSIAKYITDGENKTAYLCGSPGMIESAIKGLEEKGITKDLIYFDEF